MVRPGDPVGSDGTAPRARVGGCIGPYRILSAPDYSSRTPRPPARHPRLWVIYWLGLASSFPVRILASANIGGWIAASRAAGLAPAPGSPPPPAGWRYCSRASPAAGVGHAALPALAARDAGAASLPALLMRRCPRMPSAPWGLPMAAPRSSVKRSPLPVAGRPQWAYGDQVG